MQLFLFGHCMSLQSHCAVSIFVIASPPNAAMLQLMSGRYPKDSTNVAISRASSPGSSSVSHSLAGIFSSSCQESQLLQQKIRKASFNMSIWSIKKITKRLRTLHQYEPSEKKITNGKAVLLFAPEIVSYVFRVSLADLSHKNLRRSEGMSIRASEREREETKRKFVDMSGDGLNRILWWRAEIAKAWQSVACGKPPYSNQTSLTFPFQVLCRETKKSCLVS